MTATRTISLPENIDAILAREAEKIAREECKSRPNVSEVIMKRVIRTMREDGLLSEKSNG
jgi:hypothetical protein